MTAPLACNAFQHPISQHLDGAPESHSTSSLANILSVFAISHLTHRDAHPDRRSVRIANGDAFSQNFSPRDFSLVGVPHNTGSANLIASKDYRRNVLIHILAMRDFILYGTFTVVVCQALSSYPRFLPSPFMTNC